MTSEQAKQLVDSKLAELSEHFEAVHILATWPDGQGFSLCYSSGKGNWYARQGMAKEFLDDAQAVNLGRIIARENGN